MKSGLLSFVRAWANEFWYDEKPGYIDIFPWWPNVQNLATELKEHGICTVDPEEHLYFNIIVDGIANDHAFVVISPGANYDTCKVYIVEGCTPGYRLLKKGEIEL